MLKARPFVGIRQTLMWQAVIELATYGFVRMLLVTSQEGPSPVGGSEHYAMFIRAIAHSHYRRRGHQSGARDVFIFILFYCALRRHVRDCTVNSSIAFWPASDLNLDSQFVFVINSLPLIALETPPLLFPISLREERFIP